MTWRAQSSQHPQQVAMWVVLCKASKDVQPPWTSATKSRSETLWQTHTIMAARGGVRAPD